MQELKQDVEKAITDSLKNRAKHFKADITQRTHTIKAFDNTAKVTKKGQQIPDYDAALLSEAKSCFQRYFSKKMGSVEPWMRSMFMEAFEKNGGQFDPKKITNISKYRDKDKDADFQKAFKLCDKAVSLKYAKSYIQIYLKNEEGEYESLVLNLNSV